MWLHPMGAATMDDPHLPSAALNSFFTSMSACLTPMRPQGKVLRFLSSQPWAPQQHAAWPPAFKAAARTLLCCAHRQPPAGAGVGVWSLPLPLLQHIVELLAGSRLDWLEREAPQAEQQQQGAVAGGGMASSDSGGSGSEDEAAPPLGVATGAASTNFVG